MSHRRISEDRLSVLKSIAFLTFQLGSHTLTHEERRELTMARNLGEQELAPLEDYECAFIDQELVYLQAGVAA